MILEGREDKIRCDNNCVWPTKCCQCIQKSMFIYSLSIPYGLRSNIIFLLNSSFESYEQVKHVYKTCEWFTVDNYSLSLISIFEDSGFEFDKVEKEIINQYILDILCSKGKAFIYKSNNVWICNKLLTPSCSLHETVEIKEKLKCLRTAESLVETITKHWQKLDTMFVFRLLSSKLIEKEVSLQVALQLFFFTYINKTFPTKILKNMMFCEDFLFGLFKTK